MSDTTTTEGLRKDAEWDAMERVMRTLSPLLTQNLLLVAAGAYPTASQFDSVAAFIELNRAWADYERVVKEKP
jgi:hypothetical protein